MSSESPLDSKEHSIYHTFKKSRWVYSQFLIYRISIIMIFLAWVTCSCYLKASNLNNRELHTSSYSLMILNHMMIPLHTLLICGSGIDRLYLSHLLLSGIFEFAYRVMFSPGIQIWITPIIGCQLMAYIYWYIPTRILYFKTFNLVKEFFNVAPNALLRKLVLPWAILFTICVSIITCLFVLSIKIPKLIPAGTGRLAISGCCTGSMMFFELYMYSKINPMKNRFTCFCSWKEITYILVAVAAILVSIVEVIAIQFTAIVRLAPVNILSLRILTRILQICRYIVLWHYCVDLLQFDRQKSESTIEINIRDDKVDLSKFTKKEIAALEIK